MKSFTIVQNLLTALVIPFLAIIVGLSSMPGIYVFYYIQEFANSFGFMSLEQLGITGIAIGMGIMTWGISLVIICGLLGGLFRPRLDPGRYPLQSFVTIQWAWSMIFHRIALFFLPFFFPCHFLFLFPLRPPPAGGGVGRHRKSLGIQLARPPGLLRGARLSAAAIPLFSYCGL